METSRSLPESSWTPVTLEPKPATNGAHLFLKLDPGRLESEDPKISVIHFAEKTFDLDLDVSSVDAFAFAGPNRLEIRGMKDVAKAGGAIERQPFAYTVSFTRSTDGAPSKTIEMTPL